MLESRSLAVDVLNLDQCKFTRNTPTLVWVDGKPGRQIGSKADGEIEAMTDRLIAEMIRNQRPLTLPTDASVAAACSRMDERWVGVVRVTDADDYRVGIFTGRDAIRMRAQRRAAGSTLGTVMTRSPDAMPPGRMAMDAPRLMQDGGFRHVPVVDRNRVVDVMSWGDFRPSEHDRLDIKTAYREHI